LRAVRRQHAPGSATWDGHPRCPPALLRGERGCGRPRRQPSVRGKEPVLVMQRDGFFCCLPKCVGDGSGEEQTLSDSIFDVPIPARPAARDERRARLLAAFDARVLVMDGATGTAMQAANLTAADFGGPELEGCNENLCATRPDVVERVHAGYLAAGCDVVETDSFGGTPLVLGEYGLSAQAYELNAAAARI